MVNELDDLKHLLGERQARPEFPPSPLPPENISLGIHGEAFRGDKQALVAIMEYSDFDCSFCSRYALEIYPRINADYVKPGKVKYFFRDLPAPEHTNSLFKARLARCAGEQGRFWEMHDWLFAHRTPLTEPALGEVLKEFDLDAAAVHECLDNGRFTEAIERSVASARRIGVRDTPAFLLGTMSQDGDTIHVAKVLLGAESYDSIQAHAFRSGSVTASSSSCAMIETMPSAPALPLGPVD